MKRYIFDEWRPVGFLIFFSSMFLGAGILYSSDWTEVIIFSVAYLLFGLAISFSKPIKKSK